MPKSCCAFGCTERFLKDSTVSFYSFPADQERRKQWIKVAKRDNWDQLKAPTFAVNTLYLDPRAMILSLLTMSLQCFPL